jgi:rpsU-divergently transcribed protein
MFQRGSIDLVFAFMRKGNIQMSLRLEQTDLAPLAVNDRIATAVRYRLEYLAPFIKTWPQAMALGLLPQNVTETVSILSEMVDEIWWHAGDRSTDLDWYSRRALLLGVYAATEAFMLQDRSPNFQDTWDFLNRRLSDASTLGQRAGESLAVAQAAVGGAVSIGAAAFEVVRPAVLTGGTALGASLNALQSALMQAQKAATGGAAAASGSAAEGGSASASSSSSASNPINDILNVGGLPLTSILNVAAPAITAAAGVVEGAASKFGVQLPPLFQAALMAVSSSGANTTGAATGTGGGSPFGGSSSASRATGPSDTSTSTNNNNASYGSSSPSGAYSAADVAAAAGLNIPPTTGNSGNNNNNLR